VSTFDSTSSAGSIQLSSTVVDVVGPASVSSDPSESTISTSNTALVCENSILSGDVGDTLPRLMPRFALALSARPSAPTLPCRPVSGRGEVTKQSSRLGRSMSVLSTEVLIEELSKENVVRVGVGEGVWMPTLFPQRH
jgi:hypothetical protein